MHLIDKSMVTGEKEYNIIYNNKQHLFPILLSL